MNDTKNFQGLTNLTNESNFADEERTRIDPPPQCV